MRRAASLLSLSLVGRVVSIALLGISQMARMPTVVSAVESGSVDGVPVSRMDPDAIGYEAPDPFPPHVVLTESITVRRDKAKVHPLVQLTLRSEPTAGGASLVAERLTYMPGATMAVRPHTQVRVLTLQAGTLEVHLDGVAFRDRQWPDGSLLAKEPHRVEGIFHLHPGDLLAIPAETAFAARNRGELPAVSLDVSVKRSQPLTPMTDRTGGTAETGDLRHERLTTVMATGPGESADVALGRLILSPGRPLDIDAPAGSLLVTLKRGSLGGIGDGSAVERQPGEAILLPLGKQTTIAGNGEHPLVAVLVRVVPSKSISGRPDPAPLERAWGV